MNNKKNVGLQLVSKGSKNIANNQRKRQQKIKEEDKLDEAEIVNIDVNIVNLTPHEIKELNTGKVYPQSDIVFNQTYINFGSLYTKAIDFIWNYINTNSFRLVYIKYIKTSQIIVLF